MPSSCAFYIAQTIDARPDYYRGCIIKSFSVDIIVYAFDRRGVLLDDTYPLKVKIDFQEYYENRPTSRAESQRPFALARASARLTSRTRR